MANEVAARKLPLAHCLLKYDERGPFHDALQKIVEAMKQFVEQVPPHSGRRTATGGLGK